MYFTFKLLLFPCTCALWESADVGDIQSRLATTTNPKARSLVCMSLSPLRRFLKFPPRATSTVSLLSCPCPIGPLPCCQCMDSAPGNRSWRWADGPILSVPEYREISTPRFGWVPNLIWRQVSFTSFSMSFVYRWMHTCNPSVIFRFCAEDSAASLPEGSNGTGDLFKVKAADWDRAHLTGEVWLPHFAVFGLPKVKIGPAAGNPIDCKDLPFRCNF